MNQNPQASNPEFLQINIPGDVNANVPLINFNLAMPAYNDHNWQFRKMRPTCFGDSKNTPGGPREFWRKKDNAGD